MAHQENKKTMVVIGSTGVGKSTFCNLVAGRGHDDDKVFKVSPSGDSCTNTTSSDEVKWRGVGFPLTLIDTPGLSDSSEDNFNNILDMVTVLEKHKKVDVFVLTINGSQLKLEQKFTDMLLIFRLCFGQQFLEKNTIVEVTNWAYDDVAIKRRIEDEETVKQKINKSIEKELQKIISNCNDGIISNCNDGIKNQVEVFFIDALHYTG